MHLGMASLYNFSLRITPSFTTCRMSNQNVCKQGRCSHICKKWHVVGGDSLGEGTVLSCFMFICTDASDTSQKSQCSNLETKIVAANFLYPLLIELNATPLNPIFRAVHLFVQVLFFASGHRGRKKNWKETSLFSRISNGTEAQVSCALEWWSKKAEKLGKHLYVPGYQLQLSLVNWLCSSVSQCWVWTLRFMWAFFFAPSNEPWLEESPAAVSLGELFASSLGLGMNRLPLPYMAITYIFSKIYIKEKDDTPSS